MDLLTEPPPESSIKADVSPSEFFSRCEAIAGAEGWQVERRKGYAGPGYDLINIYLVKTVTDEVMLKMASIPSHPRKIISDVITHWSSNPIQCDEYVRTIKKAYSSLFQAYAQRFGYKPRLSIGRCPPIWDRSTVDCHQLSYAREKFHEAVRGMAVGEGDVRSRPRSAYMTLCFISPDELPPPLQPHLAWIYHELTCREPRYQGQGRLEVTLSGMQNRTGVKIAERILAVADALDGLCGGSDS